MRAGRVTLLGVSMDIIESLAMLRERFGALLRSRGSAFVATPNPEMLLSAKNDASFAACLNSADLSLPDGIGIVLVSLLRRQRIKRWPGIDAASILLTEAHGAPLRVLLLGGFHGIGARAAQTLQHTFPGHVYGNIGDDVSFDDKGESDLSVKVDAAIRDFFPTIIFVGLGAKKQERWIFRHRDAFPSVRVMMGVGGAFDIWAGRFRRAPDIVRAIGFEWLWRLLQEPWRLSRVLKATIVFPWYALQREPRR